MSEKVSKVGDNYPKYREPKRRSLSLPEEVHNQQEEYLHRQGEIGGLKKEADAEANFIQQMRQTPFESIETRLSHMRVNLSEELLRVDTALALLKTDSRVKELNELLRQLGL